ncbi:MAG: lipase family protein [Selenomonadaceae bacterium]|nr:lipase family protein [Selenomonadaceae bacterium]
MKKLFLVAFVFLFMLINIAKVSAAESKLDEAEMRLLCSICSFGAYSGDESFLMRSMLDARGWQIEKLYGKTNRAETKGYLISKDDVKILTISGTESMKDVEVDFRVGRVNLDNNKSLGNDEETIKENVFVHRGFRDYTDVVLGDGLEERLRKSLEQNPNETLYLTGHSLGGSVAILAGIRLVKGGISKDRIKVITFGSAAVGSKAFAETYGDTIDLTRVVMKGDVIKKSLQALGYVQFGEAIEYKQSRNSEHFEHSMAAYLDCAIRDYYAAGGTLRIDDAEGRINTPIYVTPFLLIENSLHKSDEDLIFIALNDSLTNHFGNLTFAEERAIEIKDKDIFGADLSKYVKAAQESKCRYILVRTISAKKIRDALSGSKNVTFEEIILNADGSLVSMQAAGSSTENLTIFEAALEAQARLTDDIANVVSK